MRLTIERAELLRTLQHVQSVVERRNTIPILNNLLVSAEEGALRLTANDMDMAVVDVAESTVGAEGRVTAPAAMLYDIVRKLPEGAQIALESEAGEKLELRGGAAVFSLNCLPVEDFPEMDEEELPTAFSIPGERLRNLVEKTRFAVSTEEIRYYLNGIYMHAVEEPGRSALRAVATDGHRLARVETALPAGAESMPGIIVPRKAVNELHKLLEGFEGEVAIALSETKIRFSVGETVLTTKLVDGTFPDYQRVIPTDNENVVTVHRRSFADAVDRVSTISDKGHAVKLGIGADKIVLSAQTTDRATASEEVPVEYAGQSIDIGFNSRYVLDMTQHIDGDTMRFAISDAASPAVVDDGDDPTVLHVLMPLRV